MDINTKAQAIQQYLKKGKTARMNYSKPLAAFALAVFASGVSGCGGGGGADGAGATLAAEGHELFKGTCAICHGPKGEGMPGLGRRLSDNAFTKSSSDADLVEFLRRGRSADDPLNERGVDMPPRGGNPSLTDADLALIVAYLRSLQ